MAILVSPGVSVTVTDESQYGPAGPGTVPFIVIATKQDKLQPGSATAIAPGTTAANAGKLWLITSQRDALQTFGNPEFYSSAGTVQQGNQLNELGLFTLYEYLGIANQAYVVRADVDLGQLIPTSIEPTGPAVSGQNWLDLSASTFGIFRSNGNPNPAFSWQPRTPLVINSDLNLEKIVQGDAATKITSGSTSCITANGNLVINGVSLVLTAGMSISTVASKINGSAALATQGVKAEVFIRTEKYSPSASGYGDVFNLRLVTRNLGQTIVLGGSTAGILTDLGFISLPENVILPASTFGNSGDFAINTLASTDGSYKNEIWEKITLDTNSGTANWWFKVGSNDSTYPGWGWREAAPRVITGTVSNPTFTAGTQCKVKIGSVTTANITVPSGGTLSGFVDAINTALNTAGVNAAASTYSVGSQRYLRLTNYDSTDITINDLSDQYGQGTPFRDAGILPTNTYWASVTGTVSNPTFVAATLKTASATSVAAGSGYAVGDTLTVVGGTFSSASVLTVASVKVIGSTPNVPGSGYNVNDTLTFDGAGFTTPVILKVDSIDGSNGITGLSIVQAGQYSGAVAPTTNVAATSTSGAGVSATVDITWGVNTVTVTTPGSYTVYPTNPVSVTGGAGTSATFNLVDDWLQSVSFSIDAGSGAVIIHVPALPNNTLDGVIDEINTVGFPNGPIVASKTADNKLKITNTNGTSFVLEDIRESPLSGAGIAAGVTYGRSLVYQGYQPSLAVPSDLQSIASTNVWINTTPGNQGANYAVKTYTGSAWRSLNIRPNTGTVPMYSSTSAADAAFGGLKQIGSVFVLYNSDNVSPAEASHVIKEWDGTSWVDLDYTPSATAPSGSPVDGTLWYNTTLRADIMVNDGTQWLGYRNAYPATDPNGPILSSEAPLEQSTLGALVDYDIWIDTSNPTYPAIYRYNSLDASWVLVDNTDQSTSKGIVFADARPNDDGTETGSEVESDMVTSNYVDPDRPDPLLYPAGMMLFNTRYSTNNVKVFRKNYLPTTYSYRDRWVNESGNQLDGSPYMGDAAQRAVIVRGLQGAISGNEEARAEETYFNLIATPGYVECLDEMITLNVDKKEVAFIVADTPATLEPTGTAFTSWANNSNNAASNGPDGLTSSTPYAAVYYPWGLGTNLNGNEVMVPASMMALRTIAYNDQVAYPWFAPAGFNRGLVTGVASVGYLNSEEEYSVVRLNQGQRDVLYTNKINPIAFIPGRGLVVYGQKTLNPVSTALDRINVVRLINYLKYNLDILAKPFLFEPNDEQTRQNVLATFNSFMRNLQTLRAVYDFAVVCDDSNNTADRIDRNELWIDIAIKPEKAIEFIYIPIRILNTGDPLPGGGV
jgi:hypothetical protein